MRSINGRAPSMTRLHENLGRTTRRNEVGRKRVRTVAITPSPTPLAALPASKRFRHAPRRVVGRKLDRSDDVGYNDSTVLERRTQSLGLVAAESVRSSRNSAPL